MRTRPSRAALLVALFALVSGTLAAYAAPLAQPAPEAARQIFLPLVARGGSAAPNPNPNPTPGGPSSDELIAAALARGEIDAETALVYRAFAVFADPRLPAKYRGRSVPSDGVIDEVGQRFPELSPATQAALRPFFLPPYHAGSWWDQRRQPAAASAIAPVALRYCDDIAYIDKPFYQDWQYIDTANGALRIWWQSSNAGDAAAATALAGDIGKIWGHLKALMGREPPSDGGDLRPCRGGSNAFDISLVDMDNAGEVIRFDRNDPKPGPWPTFMLLNRNPAASVAASGLSADQVRRASLIHELMHAFQFAFNHGPDYHWWNDATANWAINYIETLEPGWLTNFEHIYAPYMLDDPDQSLSFEGLHKYGAYLFPFFWQLKTGQVGFIRTSYERSENIANSLANINGLLPDGLREEFPRFTLRMLNTPPVDDFRKADGLPHKVKLRGDFKVALEGQRARSFPLDGNVKFLASQAYHFTFEDAAVRSVMFRNPYPDKNAWPTAAVRALVRVGNTWREEDWTPFKTRALCRDRAADRVEELYVVVSNTEFADRSHVLKPTTPPRLEVSNVACRGWKGVVRYHDWNRDEIADGVYLSEQTVEYETPLTLVLSEAPLGLYDGALHFSPAPETAIKVHAFGWSLDGSEPPRKCTYDNRMTTPIALERSSLVIYGDSGAYWADGDTPKFTVGGGDSCDSTGSMELSYSWWLIENSSSNQAYVSPDGTHITGRYDRVTRAEDPNNEAYYTWDLTALPPE